MRLFYAVTFDENVRRQLAEIQDRLRAQTLRGNFTLFDNLHLTLVFIGEVPPERAPPLFEIAKSTQTAPFRLRIRGAGSFRREGGQLVWAGVEENDRLTETYEKLAGRVAAAGFRVEARKFTPHLTLARNARFRDGFSLQEFSRGLAAIDATVAKVSLMQSERIGGRLTYTEIA
ncbi:2'-5' RNA ligase [Sporobacter termitidis DSM 10068]|uniref:RNA 2',3'-cyclic phosphodiesterase n=1 Tax=Sporobacter termitidis DSM 10068 TaxID=1123282 RepID=A0A1M5YH63_9FIRM|nr:RNA 2',3'-cyclic phosphodiesterase [Sporobacter termitidis]SHI11322.1 2'-5' RNA ligase [Sporobacter termitidis DSM 10068]